MPPIPVHNAARRKVLIVGATFAPRPAAPDPDAFEPWYEARDRAAWFGRGRAAHGGEEWTRFGTPYHVWLPLDVDGQLDVTITVDPEATPVP